MKVLCSLCDDVDALREDLNVAHKSAVFVVPAIFRLFDSYE